MDDEFDLPPDTTGTGGPFAGTVQQAGEEAQRRPPPGPTSPPAINPALGRLIDAAAARQRARQPEPGVPARDAAMPIAAVFPSKSGGGGHVVNVVELADGQRAVTCTCEAMRSIGSRPRGCWAMVRMREIVGLTAVDNP